MCKIFMSARGGFEENAKHVTSNHSSCF